MIGLKPWIVFAVVSLCGVVLGNEDGELKAVIVLFRHGDRSPLSSWPNDEYFGDSSLWPDGYGALNNMGKQRHYRLGQWFRERYDGFLPARYNSSDIYVRSTDVDRTLMSAASNLAGLYPPVDDQVWNENIPWQAIPIHTLPEDEDIILTDHAPCPKHARLSEELLKSEEIQLYNQEHAEFYQNISEVTGFDVDEVNFQSISEIFSVITIYNGFNLSLPDWTRFYWPEIQEIAAKKFQLTTYTQELARLRAGPFNNYLTNHLKGVKEETAVKFLMLSAHDTTIAERTNAIGIYPGAVPAFASTVIWEVKSRNGNNNDLYLNTYFRNDTHFSPLTVPGCEFDCDISKFAEILKPITVTNDQWTKECYEHLNYI